MRPILPALALAGCLAVPMAHADDGPVAGGYVLINTVLDGVAAGQIVPIYTRMELSETAEGGHMEFYFITAFHGDAAMCAQSGKCDREVNALGLDFTATADGRIAVTDHEIRTGADLTIDRAEFDLPYIIQPMLTLVDGAAVTWSPGEITLSPQGWTGGRTARFLAADRDTVLDAVGFALSFEVSLGQLDHCVMRQLMEIAGTSSLFRSEADAAVLAVAHLAGLMMRLDDAAIAMAPGPSEEQPDLEAMRAARAPLLLLRLALAYTPWQEGEDTAAVVDEALEAARPATGDAFDTLRAELILPNLDAIAAARRYYARFVTLLEQGHDPVALLCRSIHLDV